MKVETPREVRTRAQLLCLPRVPELVLGCPSESRCPEAALGPALRLAPHSPPRHLQLPLPQASAALLCHTGPPTASCCDWPATGPRVLPLPPRPLACRPWDTRSACALLPILTLRFPRAPVCTREDLPQPHPPWLSSCTQALPWGPAMS